MFDGSIDALTEKLAPVAMASQQTVDDLTPLDHKHLLEHPWTMWFDNPLSKNVAGIPYGQTLRRIHTFNTVEDFWCLHNNIRAPGCLLPNASFYLFKDSIEPKWEDVSNAKGGCWAANISVTRGPGSKQDINMWWINTVMAVIGEQFDKGSEICGVSVCIRHKSDRIEVWTRTALDEEAQMSIGRQLQQFLDMPHGQRVSYSVHADKLGNIHGINKNKDLYSL